MHNVPTRSLCGDTGEVRLCCGYSERNSSPQNIVVAQTSRNEARTMSIARIHALLDHAADMIVQSRQHHPIGLWLATLTEEARLFLADADDERLADPLPPTVDGCIEQATQLAWDIGIEGTTGEWAHFLGELSELNVARRQYE